MNKKHRISGLVISNEDWLLLSVEDRGFYVDTVLQVTDTLITHEDMERYLEA